MIVIHIADERSALNNKEIGNEIFSCRNMQQTYRNNPGNEIFPATENDYPQLAEIWESAVKATHDFLSREDMEAIASRLQSDYFPAVKLFVSRLADGTPVAFAGISEGHLEMLFVRNEFRGRGFGSRLLDFAIRQGVDSVDVNEQNPQALGFYLSHGFAVISRDETDPDGRPYPILHLSLQQ